MAVPGSANPLLLVQGDTNVIVSRSLRFNAPDSAYLIRTPSSNGTSYTTWTWSMWVKRSALGNQVIFSAGTNTTDYLIVNFQADDSLRFLTGETGPTNQNLVTTAAVFRDLSAWYHIVIQADFGNATQTDRIKIYVNGIRQTISGTIAAQNYAGTTFNRSGIAHNIGRQGNGVAYFSGYLAEIHFIDGQALTPSSFAETNATTGQWVPKAFSGSYGTNGFKLTFSDNSNTTSSTLGKDTSGNNNDWTCTNFSVATGAGNDSLVDTPTSYGTDTSVGGEVRGNYCTWNPLVRSAQLVFSNGNLDLTINRTGSFVWSTVPGTVAVNSGKWYCEITCVNSSGSQNVAAGIVRADQNLSGYFLPGDVSQFAYAYFGDGRTRYSTINSGQPVNYGASYTNGDVIGIAYDADAGTLVFYKNGVSQGTAFSSISASIPWSPFAAGGNADNNSWTLNAGQRPFAYTAPSGFKALCDTNLPTPTIVRPSTVFDTKLYTGNGTNQAIGGYGFSPDLVWIKCRSFAYDHFLLDTARGADRMLKTNSTLAEDPFGIPSFNSDGFTTNGSVNGMGENGRTFVAWAWDAGSSTVTNTQGSITSSVRANASAGLSIVTYTGNGSSGATIGHGLNAVPSLIIGKQRSATNDWVVFHAAVGNTSALFLNLTSTPTASALYWNNTSPSSTVFTVGSGTGLNQNNGTYVAYCFAPVSGFSAFGSYLGTGSADGPFQWCGFRPRWLLVKYASASNDWYVFDAARNPYNAVTLRLCPNGSFAEADVTASIGFDFLSNGFKVFGTNAYSNASSGTYVWAAFAESPFQYARAR